MRLHYFAPLLAAALTVPAHAAKPAPAIDMQSISQGKVRIIAPWF